MRTGEKRRNRGSRIAELVILIVAPVVCHYLIPIMTVIRPPYSYTGAAIMLAGFGLMILAATEFRKAGTGFQLDKGGSVLVTSGPFRFSRNPIYLGMLVWLAGFAVLLGSLIVFIFPVLFFLLAQFIMIPMEEKKMEQAYGKEYDEYRRRVGRWL